MQTGTDPKRAAIERWTADRCGTNEREGEPGSRAYCQRLGHLAGRYVVGYGERA